MKADEFNNSWDVTCPQISPKLRRKCCCARARNRPGVDIRTARPGEGQETMQKAICEPSICHETNTSESQGLRHHINEWRGTKFSTFLDINRTAATW